MHAQAIHLFLVLTTYYCLAVSLQVTCNVTFSDLKHSITKVICPANCLTHSHELCGNRVYSRGPICLAAIQDQQIDNSGGLVTVYKANGKLKYLGGQRNGVFSQFGGPSNVSYTFRMTCSTDGNSETDVTQVVCPSNCAKLHVYPCGTEFYLGNSSVCGAAYNSSIAKVGKPVKFYKTLNDVEPTVGTTCRNSFTFKDINECDLGHRCENNSTCVDGIMEYFCACPNGYFGRFCQGKTHCWTNKGLESFVSSEGIETVCDKGWTIFQSRIDPTVNFTRPWIEYEKGFGNFSSSFWWGLENLHQSTKNGNCSLRVDLWDFYGNHEFAVYRLFSVSSKEEQYRLKIADYQNISTAVDAMTGTYICSNDYPCADSNGMNFSTYDNDNDIFSGNCASMRGGGWWYNRCGLSGLNGQVENALGLKYVRWQKPTETLFPWRNSTMKFRCA